MGRTPRMKLRGKRANPFDWVERHCKSDSREVMLDAQLHNNRHIYHLLPWPYAKKILDNRRLRLTPVDAWPDPYERWCCHQVFRTPNTVHGMQAYALCWTIGQVRTNHTGVSQHFSGHFPLFAFVAGCLLLSIWEHDLRAIGTAPSISERCFIVPQQHSKHLGRHCTRRHTLHMQIAPQRCCYINVMPSDSRRRYDYSGWKPMLEETPSSST